MTNFYTHESIEKAPSRSRDELIGDPNHCDKAEAKLADAISKKAEDNEPTADERAAIGLYAILARDFSDFIDMIKDASQETLTTLYDMLITPNDDHDASNKELNALGANLVQPLLKSPLKAYPKELVQHLLDDPEVDMDRIIVRLPFETETKTESATMKKELIVSGSHEGTSGRIYTFFATSEGTIQITVPGSFIDEPNPIQSICIQTEDVPGLFTNINKAIMELST